MIKPHDRMHQQRLSGNFDELLGEITAHTSAGTTGHQHNCFFHQASVKIKKGRILFSAALKLHFLYQMMSMASP
jgi:hypothetical protein